MNKKKEKSEIFAQQQACFVDFTLFRLFHVQLVVSYTFNTVLIE